MKVIFPPLEAKKAANEYDSASTVGKGHGRIEQRSITTTSLLKDYLNWPGAWQVFKVVRTRTIRGKATTETSYGITSLSPEQANADRLLTLVRGHWCIENSLHYVRDVTFGEDASRVRTGSAPVIMAGIRNIAVTLLNRAGVKNKAEALRHFAAHPKKAIAMVKGKKN